MISRSLESLIRSLGTRHGRAKNAESCLVEGLRACGEAAKLRPELVQLCVLRGDTPFEFSGTAERVDEKLFDSLASTVNPQGVLMLCKTPEYAGNSAPLSDPWVLFLDRIADPGNFGTILRTARAAGLHELWMAKGGVDPFCAKAVRAGMGAQFAVKIRVSESLEAAAGELSALGIRRFYRTEPAGGNSLFTEKALFEKSAVILGNEANGAAPLAGSVPLVIPMPGSAESLNVAQAATVVLFEYVRRVTTMGGAA